MMMERRDHGYGWKRFWHPRGDEIPLVDGGYLPDPESVGTYYRRADGLVTFSAIAHYSCLILLGEPGSGKSTAMETERESSDAAIMADGATVLRLDLHSYGSGTELLRDLFEHSTFTSWVTGTQTLYLFLDSLDECRFHIPTVAALLERELSKCPVDRLCLRIACRTADWPQTLEKTFEQLWEEDAVRAYELAPLRRVDVALAARTRGVDADAFLAEVARMEVVPLAIKPVTLELLLNLYKSGGGLPHTREELYHRGCLLLCEEPNESRLDAGVVGTLDADKRMMVAGRVAAITVFGNRYALWTAPDRDDVPEGDIAIRRLCGTESVGGVDMFVDEAALKETLGTGLFSSRGPHRIGWAHQTYAEFLAADYLVTHKAPLSQMLTLIVHNEDQTGKLVPQLREAAAQLASLDHRVFKEIMTREPEVLLRSDITTADEGDRAALVDAILTITDERRLLSVDDAMSPWYAKLAHRDLANQLRPYVRDADRRIAAREVAIHIVHACDLRSLQHDLVDVALDTGQPGSIRVHAASTVASLGDEQAKVRLRPLLTDTIGDDPHDDLKGAVLRALWPDHLTTRDLFDVLTPPKARDIIGLYRAFLRSLPDSVAVDDLPIALEWCARQLAPSRGSWDVETLASEFLLRGWRHLSHPGMVDAFSELLLAKAVREEHSYTSGYFDKDVREGLQSDADKRRHVLHALLSMLIKRGIDAAVLSYTHMPVVLQDDVAWLVGELRSTQSKEMKRLLVRIISSIPFHGDQVHHEVLYDACQHEPLLLETFSWMFTGVVLHSPQARSAREYDAREQQWRARQETVPVLDPPPLARIENLLGQCETGDTVAWWRLNMEMTLEPTSTDYGDEGEADLTVLPGWQAVDTTTRARIVEAARQYVRAGESETDEWLGQNVIHRPAFAGYRALRLLLQEDPSNLSSLPASVWQKWAPIILAYPTSTDGPDNARQELLKIAYAVAPETIIAALNRLIDSENMDQGNAFILRLVDVFWDDPLGLALLNKVQDPALKPEYMGEILAVLFDRRTPGVRAFTESLVPTPLPPGGDDRAMAIVAARILLTHADDAGWAVVWPAIQQDSDFGDDVISVMAHQMNFGIHRVNLVRVLTEAQLADLYAWLVDRYSYAEDPVASGYLGPRHSVARWRDAILDQLVDRGTPESYAALQRRASTLPDVNRLHWALLQAEEVTRRNTWSPPTPEDILALSADAKKRLVRNGEQPLDVLEESLRRLEDLLHDETPAAIDLWNECRRHTKVSYTPKDENTFSDYVKRHLDADLKRRGVIINREVEFRRKRGKTDLGERTDIHVDAMRDDSRNGEIRVITAIIEAKGCWHDELATAMEVQLVDRYLRDSSCEHGLYLVGWFNWAEWDAGDRRKRAAPTYDKDHAQDMLDSQAAFLSARNNIYAPAVVLDTSLSMHRT